jgi:outer membrane protein assembly factor BamB
MMRTALRVGLTLAAPFFLAAVTCDTPTLWSTYQYDAGHSGYVPVSLDPAKFALRWQQTIGDGKPLNPIAVGEGKVFVSNRGYFNDAGLYVHDAENGGALWNVRYGDVFSVNPPAYYDGKVYIQTGNHSTDTYLRAYRADGGDLVFQAAHAAQWESYLAPTIVGGTAYINGGYYGGMYAFDATDGTQRWFFSGLAQYDEWTPAVDADYAYAYVGGILSAVSRTTGTLAFEIDDPKFVWPGWSMGLAPTLGGLGDVIAIQAGRLLRFDLAKRSIAFQLKRNFTGQPSVAKGVIYAIDAGALTAWEQTTGSLLWSFGASGEKLVGPILVTDTHVLVPGEKSTFAVDLSTHRADWTYAATGSLALAANLLFIAGADGVLTAIEAVPPPDGDGDGVADRSDDCPDVPNAGQEDRDHNGLGDACNDAEDGDGDEFADAIDNCPELANPDQADRDGDAIGDACDPFPDDGNNDFAQCRVDRDASDARLAQLEQELERMRAELDQCLGTLDTDGDGVGDSGDACPATARGSSTDAQGCSLAQFCALQSVEPAKGHSSCARAIWLGDEAPTRGCMLVRHEDRLVCTTKAWHHKHPDH